MNIRKWYFKNIQQRCTMGEYSSLNLEGNPCPENTSNAKIVQPCEKILILIIATSFAHTQYAWKFTCFPMQIRFWCRRENIWGMKVESRDIWERTRKKCASLRGRNCKTKTRSLFCIQYSGTIWIYVQSCFKVRWFSEKFLEKSSTLMFFSLLKKPLHFQQEFPHRNYEEILSFIIGVIVNGKMAIEVSVDCSATSKC